MKLTRRQKFRNWIRCLRPLYWLTNYRISNAWDRRLNEMLDSPDFSSRDLYTVTLNGEVLWVANFPFAYGHRYKISEAQPRRRTKVRLMDALDNYDAASSKEEKQESQEWPEFISGKWM